MTRRGFTLIEILVGIGILVLLMSLILAATSRARRQARETRCRADMQSIGVAIAAYQADFGDIPRAASNVPGATQEAALCNSLIAPGPSTEDGKDGPGFRARPGGRTYGPYLDPDRFKFEFANRTILDLYGLPYKYVPAVRSYTLTSAGEDGVFGTKDDLQ